MVACRIEARRKVGCRKVAMLMKIFCSLKTAVLTFHVLAVALRSNDKLLEHGSDLILLRAAQIVAADRVHAALR